MELREYDGKIIRVTDSRGRAILGAASYDPAEDCLRLGGQALPAQDISGIEVLPDFAILRATETWQQAGAYYVRIQAMAKKHHITLRQEFDGHDGPDTRYIVVTDRAFPIATARLYPLDGGGVMIGRVVVLPEYRHQGIGTMVVQACEEWAGELGFRRAVLESRDNKVAFYQQLGYEVRGEAVEGDTFRCVRMEKNLPSGGKQRLGGGDAAELPDIAGLRLNDLQPSQFYISEKKLREVEDWFRADDLSGFAPIPVKWLDGRPVMTDGHTRAVAALRAGLTAVPLVRDEDELDWELYRRCVEACGPRQVFSPADLLERIIPEAEYDEKWNRWCDEMHAEVDRERKAGRLRPL